jgi:hypothetical protein
MPNVSELFGATLTPEKITFSSFVQVFECKIFVLCFIFFRKKYFRILPVDSVITNVIFTSVPVYSNLL